MKLIVPKASRGVNAQPIALPITLFRKLWDFLFALSSPSSPSRFVALSGRSQ